MGNKGKATGVRKEGLPAPSKVIKDARKAALITTPMTMEEKIQCLDIFSELKDVAMTAVKMNRSEVSIRKFLARYLSTTRGARLTLEAGAEKLARRIVNDANVEEALEVMDRLDVLNAKQEKSGPSTSFNLVIGMPSSGPRVAGTVPVPSQAQIEEAAVDAEVVSGKS